METAPKLYLYENPSTRRYKFGFYRYFARGIARVIKPVSQASHPKPMRYGFGFKEHVLYPFIFP